MASKPVAKTRASSSISPSATRTPVGVISTIGVAPEVDERDVGAVERVVVAGVEARPLGRRTGGRVGDSASATSGSSTMSRICWRTNSAAGLVGRRVEQQVAEAAADPEQEPAGPSRPRSGPARSARVGVERASSLGDVEQDPDRRVAWPAPGAAGSTPCSSAHELGVERRVAAPASRSSASAGRRSGAAACSAISGIDWMPDEPVPITPTRWPVKSTPSCGQRPVW